jgi:hypothetical protein
MQMPPPTGLIDPPNQNPGPVGACKLPVTPRLQRLTRTQYENSIRALTGLKGDLAGNLPQDPFFAGFNRGNDLEVSDLVGRVYREQAEIVARQVVASADSLKQVVPCATKDDACATEFVNGFGLRAFRRPLTSDETQRYLGLFKQADGLVETGDTFTKGVRVVVEAMLQSPRFLYRAETSTGKAGAPVALSSYEIAQKLSFTLANVTPDAELLAAAAKNELVNPDKVAAQARRLVATPEGRATVREFASQWVEANHWDERFEKPSHKGFKDLSSRLQQEPELLFDEVTFNMKKGLATLYTTNIGFVNKGTAAYYGLMGTFGDTMTKTELDRSKRSGLVTQVGLLSAHAYGNRSSPIHRGVAVGRQFLCTPIPDPVPNVAPLPPSAAGKTMRQIVTEHTGAQGCKECHYNFINPLGFGLENFDEVGRWRDSDMGQPVDATGTLVGTEKNQSFNGPIELAKAIVDAPESRTCFARQWWRYAFGRMETDDDSCALNTLANGLKNDSYTAVDLLVDLTRTQAFMFRSAEAQ